MSGRPRVVIATPNRAECDVLADWLTSEGYEPVGTVSPRAAAGEIQARTFDLLVADFAMAFRAGLHALSRGRTHNAYTPTVVIGPADEESRGTAGRHHALYIERPVDRSALVSLVSTIFMEDRPVGGRAGGGFVQLQ